MKDDFYVTKYLTEKAEIYTNIDVEMSIQFYLEAINKYTMDDDISISLCAKMWANIADLLANTYKDDKTQTKRIIDAYISSADLYQYKNYSGIAHRMLLKAVNICIISGNYTQAYELMDKIVTNRVRTGYSPYITRENIVSTILCCILVDGLDSANEKLGSYCDECLEFAGSREEKFVKTLIKSLITRDIQAYSNCMKNPYLTMNTSGIQRRMLIEIQNRYIENNYDVQIDKNDQTCSSSSFDDQELC